MKAMAHALELLAAPGVWCLRAEARVCAARRLAGSVWQCHGRTRAPPLLHCHGSVEMNRVESPPSTFSQSERVLRHWSCGTPARARFPAEPRRQQKPTGEACSLASTPACRARISPRLPRQPPTMRRVLSHRVSETRLLRGAPTRAPCFASGAGGTVVTSQGSVDSAGSTARSQPPALRRAPPPSACAEGVCRR